MLYKLLIVEDEEFIRRGIRNQISWNELGYEVVGEAENGRAALEIVPLLKPDVILTDIKMPVINGIELISILKQQDSCIRFVVISGYRDFEYAQKSIDLKVFSYILKPTRKDLIIDVFTKLKEELDESNSKAIKENRNGQGAEFIVCGKILENEADNIKRSIKYINENYSKKITLKEIADYSYMSVSYFCVLFKQVAGQSFIDYQMILRTEKAKELLSSTGLRVCEISEIVGYDDICYFNRIFKKLTGVSPKKYRESLAVTGK